MPIEAEMPESEIEVPLDIDQVRSLAKNSILQLRTFTAEIAKLDDSTDAGTTTYLLDMLEEEINA